MDSSVEQRLQALEQKLETHEEVSVEDIEAAASAGGGPSEQLGAQIVARAWADESFRRALLESPMETLADGGWPAPGGSQPLELTVVENTPEVHNVIVCTLCSCYPRWLLGSPPDWYASEEYRANIVRDPRETLRAFGLEVPADQRIDVWDSTAESRFMVLPMAPAGAERMDAAELEALVTRDHLIGTAVV